MKSVIKRAAPAVFVAGLFVCLLAVVPNREISISPETSPAVPPQEKEGGPEWQREYFARLHAPYPSVLPPEVQRRILAKVEAMPHEDPAKAAGTWELVGPSGMLVGGDALHSGRVLDIDAVTGSQTMVGAASGGLWRYRALFPVPIADDLPDQWIGSFTVDPADEDIILVGTGEPYTYGSAGLYKTFDGGLTWHDRDMGEFPGEFYKIRYGPDGTTVHAAAMLGYFRSPDRGETWQRTINGTVTDVAVHPTDPLVVYVTVQGQGLFVSADGGVTWDQMTNAPIPTSNVTRGAVSVCASAPNVIYAAFAQLGPNGGDIARGIYRTTNSGLSWTDISPGYDYMNGQGWYNNALAVCPTDPDLVLAGGVDMLRSVDGGTTWQIMPDEPHLHGDHHVIQWHPNGLYVWAGHDGGWSYSQQQGEPGSWISNGNTLPITQLVHLDVEGADWATAVVAAAGQDNGVCISDDGGSTWWQSIGADASGINIVDGWPDLMYMTAGYFNNGLAFHPDLSVDGGLTWFEIVNGLPDSDAFYPAVRLDGSNRALVHYAHYVYEYDFGANVWHQVGNPIPTRITEMTVCPQPGVRVIYVCALASFGAPGQVWVLDGGDMFQNRVNGLPPQMDIKKVVPDPRDSYRAYALVEGLGPDTTKVYLTTNRGLNWTDISGDLPNVPVVDMVVHPDDSRLMYLGSEFGYFHSRDGGGTWEPWHEGLPRAVIASEMRMVDMREQGGGLWVVSATFGRGIWRCRVTEESDVVPAPQRPLLVVGGARPNPFNPATVIPFALASPATIRADVHDLAGRRVRRLLSADLPEGDHVLRWDGRDGAGRRLPAGVYIVRLTAGGQEVSLKVTLVE